MVFKEAKLFILDFIEVYFHLYDVVICSAIPDVNTVNLMTFSY